MSRGKRFRTPPRSLSPHLPGKDTGGHRVQAVGAATTAGNPIADSFGDVRQGGKVSEVSAPVADANGPGAQLIIPLSADWRVVSDDLQWVLELRRGKPTKKSTGWQGRRLHMMRDNLVRSIEELCGRVDPDALAEVAALPERHPGWMARIAAAMRGAG